MRIRRLLAVLLAALLLPAIPVQAEEGTAYPTPEGYNANDYQKMVTFLEKADESGKKNGQKLSSTYDPAKPGEWGEVINGKPFGIVWEEEKKDDEEGNEKSDKESGEKFISQINISGLELVGNLDLSGFENLRTVECASNNITSINVSNCNSLIILNCDDNKLTALNVSSCTNLNELHCQNNKITSLNVSFLQKLTQLLCSGNGLTTLTFFMNNALTFVNCSDNQLTGLNFMSCMINGNLSLICSRNPLGNNLMFGSVNSVITLWCESCNMTRLNVSSFRNLGNLIVSNNNITTLDLSKNTKIMDLDVSGNVGLQKIDVTNLPDLRHFYCNDIGLESLDVTANADLMTLKCANNNLTQLDLSQNTTLQVLDCSGNDLTEVKPVSAALIEFVVKDNPNLTSISPLSLFPYLWGIDTRGTSLGELDIPNDFYAYSCEADKQEIDFTSFANIPIGKITAVGDGAVGVACEEEGNNATEETMIYTLTAKGTGFKGWYKDEAGTELITEEEEYTFNDLEVTGKSDYYAIFSSELGEGHIHRYGPWSVTRPATCEEKGTESRACTMDGETETRDIPATGHRNVSHIEARDATYYTDGNIEYWRCADCGTCFLDDGLKEEVSYSRVVIPAYGTPTVPPTPDKPVTEPDTKFPVFSDVAESAWYSEAVDFVAQKGVMMGVDSELFDPEGEVTRGMMMTIIARLDGEDTSGGETWYEKGVSWAVKLGISDGLRPEQYATRQELVTMLWRYAGQSVLGSNALDRFLDGGDVSEYAKDAMSWAIEYGIIRGNDEGLLEPFRTVKRSETATMIMRFSQVFLREAAENEIAH